MENDELAKIRFILSKTIQFTRQTLHDDIYDYNTYWGLDAKPYFEKRLKLLIENYIEDDLTKAKEQFAELDKMNRNFIDTIALFHETRPREREPKPEPIKNGWFW
jgi:hypothetical protein